MDGALGHQRAQQAEGLSARTVSGESAPESRPHETERLLHIPWIDELNVSVSHFEVIKAGTEREMRKEAEEAGISLDEAAIPALVEPLARATAKKMGDAEAARLVGVWWAQPDGRPTVYRPLETA